MLQLSCDIFFPSFSLNYSKHMAHWSTCTSSSFGLNFLACFFRNFLTLDGVIRSKVAWCYDIMFVCPEKMARQTKTLKQPKKKQMSA